jgi:hypothetical protein
MILALLMAIAMTKQRLSQLLKTTWHSGATLQWRNLVEKSKA